MIKCPRCKFKTLETSPRTDDYPMIKEYDDGRWVDDRKLLTILFYCTHCGFQQGTGWIVSKLEVIPIRNDTEFNDYIERILEREK